MRTAIFKHVDKLPWRVFVWCPCKCAVYVLVHTCFRMVSITARWQCTLRCSGSSNATRRPMTPLNEACLPTVTTLTHPPFLTLLPFSLNLLLLVSPPLISSSEYSFHSPLPPPPHLPTNEVVGLLSWLKHVGYTVLRLECGCTVNLADISTVMIWSSSGRRCPWP